MNFAARNLLVAWLGWALLCLGLTLLPDSYFFVVAMFGAIPILLAWLAIAIWSLKIGARSFWDQTWLSLSAFLAPVVIPFLVVQAIPYAQYPEDYAHFVAMRPVYDAAVARLPKDGRRFAEFNWGGMLFASKGVVYDETDEVGRPFGHQSAEWKRRMKNTDLTCGLDGPVGEVIPLEGHYFVVGFGC